jgi:hypothetical protein
MPWLTLISSQFIYLIVIALLRQLNDPLLLLHESRPQLRQWWWSGGCRYELADTINIGPVHLHGGSRRIFSDLVGGERMVERMPG